jgi:hypothetical protein
LIAAPIEGLGMHRLLPGLLGLALAATFLVAAPGGAAQPCEDVFCAGAASVDMTWHVGAGQGQLGSAPGGPAQDRFDPFHHSLKLAPSHGHQSRTFAKAVVVQGADGEKAAYVKTELYLQQDLMTRRVAELVAGTDPTLTDFAVDGLDGARIMLGGTHNHSAPHHTSTAWGVWVFADAFDFRQFEATARAIARSIKEADEARQPARMSASVISFRDVQQNILGPSTADDGSPSGFPRDHFDDELAVVRLEARDGSEPIAALVNLGLHPESISSTDMLSSDWLGLVERDVERGLGKPVGSEDGPVVAFAQGGLGDLEPDQSRANPAADGREYWRRDFAQMERMSRLISDAILAAWEDAALPAGAPGHGDRVEGKHVPPTTDVPVGMLAYRFPGPLTHPAPTISNCRTEHPGIPVAGLPDCQRLGDPPGWGTTHDLLKDAGIRVPDQYGAPGFPSVQEQLTIHLQVLQIGDVVLAACPCEPISDMSLNFKSRADAVEGNLDNGYEWECRETDGEEEGGVECDFRHASFLPPDWRPVSREAYERMRAHVRNDAAGWEDDWASIQGASEPRDPAEIRGNFTHDELDAVEGFTIPLMVGTANDYVGYVVTYREYQRGDHYRKALTAFGPRTADYINTRLVDMLRELRGGESPADARTAVMGGFDDLVQDGKVRIVGPGSVAATQAYEAAIPDDGGTPGEVVAEPADIERFDAATFTWQGGSNWTDNPLVAVERFVPGPPAEPGRPETTPPGRWEPVADQVGGDVVVTLDYDSWGPEAATAWLTGGKTYVWTATFEATEQTSPGRYRFVVDGHHRDGRTANPYSVVSEEFRVDVWEGLAATDLRVDGDVVTFGVAGQEQHVPAGELPGPVEIAGDEVRYPATYEADLPFLHHELFERGPHRYCFRCTFRAWAHHGQVASATVAVDRAAGGTTTHTATFDGEHFVTVDLALQPGDVVRIPVGGVVDVYGNTNGAAAMIAVP